jgi:hypothetical protein
MTDRQLSKLSPVDALGFSHCLIAGLQDPAGINQKRFSSLCQCDPLPLSLEQVNSELALEVLDLFAEGRLRYVQPIRRMGKIQLLGRGDKVFKMSNFHQGSRFVRPRLSQRFMRTR